MAMTTTISVISPLAQKKEKTVSTQKTFHKQTAAFLAALVGNLPRLAAEEMQYLIENPDELKRRLKTIEPGFRELGLLRRNIVFVELDPNWDFLILRSTEYPQVGIAVSDRNGAGGEGWKLVARNLTQRGFFTSPCGCCSQWHGQLETSAAMELVRTTCRRMEIQYLILHCWHNIPKVQNPHGGLTLIDPYRPVEMEILERDRFTQAFGWLSCLGRDDEEVPLM